MKRCPGIALNETVTDTRRALLLVLPCLLVTQRALTVAGLLQTMAVLPRILVSTRSMCSRVVVHHLLRLGHRRHHTLAIL